MESIRAFIANPDMLAYLSIPFVSGVIGWFTNLIAIKMMFYPIEFVGIPPLLGWQGIVPSRIAEMATVTVDLMTSKLISIKEVFSRLEPKEISSEMEEYFLSMIEPMIEDIMVSYSPVLWETMPMALKKRIYQASREDMPQVVERIMSDLQDNIEEILDVRRMVVDALLRKKELMNDIFLQCGAKEFKFIEHSGFYFGFLFGIGQMAIWYFFPRWWLLPFCGLLVGYATNWLALKMIFEPKKPIRLGFIALHALFLKRQNEVAEKYSEIIAREILYTRNIIDAIFRGPATDLVFRIVQNHMKKSVDKTAGLAKPFVQVVMGTKRYIEMKERVCDKVLEQMPKSLIAIEEYAEKQMDIRRMLREKLAGLAPEDYEGILRPAFQQDEWKLIIAGAVLGLAAGFAQLFFVFKDSL